MTTLKSLIFFVLAKNLCFFAKALDSNDLSLQSYAAVNLYIVLGSPCQKTFSDTECTDRSSFGRWWLRTAATCVVCEEDK